MLKAQNLCPKCGNPKNKEVFCRSRVVNGKVYLPKKGEFFHFWVCDCARK